jgi:hypothetical protein
MHFESSQVLKISPAISTSGTHSSNRLWLQSNKYPSNEECVPDVEIAGLILSTWLDSSMIIPDSYLIRSSLRPKNVTTHKPKTRI